MTCTCTRCATKDAVIQKLREENAELTAALQHAQHMLDNVHLDDGK